MHCFGTSCCRALVAGCDLLIGRFLQRHADQGLSQLLKLLNLGAQGLPRSLLVFELEELFGPVPVMFSEKTQVLE